MQPWEIETPSGMNGGKSFKSSQRSKFRRVWSWSTLMDKIINLNCMPTKLLSQISSTNPEFCVCGNWN
jgi:hypothetical protein